jgi:hypothetical protein
MYKILIILVLFSNVRMKTMNENRHVTEAALVKAAIVPVGTGSIR